MTSSRYRIFGSELSPYSVKVRSYFRYKQLPHEWIVRSSANMAEYQKYAKLPLIPLVITPDDQGIQDSTPIIEALEAKHPEPSIHPPDPALTFVSALIEEYGDEWGNKPMFHYRWFYEPDQKSAAQRLVRDNMPGLDAAGFAQTCEMLKQRMVPRLRFVGSSATTKDQIEGSLRRQLAILEKHLSGRKYLLGGRPALADFGVAPQLYQCSTDPTPSAIMKQSAPNVLRWIERMLDPKVEGEFEGWGALRATLEPLLREEVAGVFLPWSAANARAQEAGEKEFTIDIDRRPFTQETQKYHAKSLGVIRAKYAAFAQKSALDPILRDTGCLEWLRS